MISISGLGTGERQVVVGVKRFRTQTFGMQLAISSVAVADCVVSVVRSGVGGRGLKSG